MDALRARHARRGAAVVSDAVAPRGRSLPRPLWAALLLGLALLVAALAGRRATLRARGAEAGAARAARRAINPRMGVQTVDPLGAGARSEGPRRVYVGAYAFNVPQLDLSSNAYLIDFWLWFRWRGDDIDPTRTYEFMNLYEGWDVLRQAIYTDEANNPRAEALGDGWHYQVFHVQARFGRPFDVRAYPFDTQQLVIAIEDGDQTTSDMVYVPDPGSTAVDPQLVIPGWILDRVTATTTETVYPTNFGDPRRPVGQDRYARFSYTLHLRRPVVGYLATTLLPIAIVMLITLVVFMIPFRYFEGRLGLGITSLISAVALQLTAAGDLPKTGYLVLLDHVYNLCYLVIFIATVESVVVVRIGDGGDEARARAIDRLTAALAAMVFFGGTAALIFAAR